MNDSALYAYGEDFEKVCESCGIRFCVFVTKQDGHNEKEEYYCPICKHLCGYIMASLPPKTQIKIDKK